MMLEHAVHLGADVTGCSGSPSCMKSFADDGGAAAQRAFVHGAAGAARTRRSGWSREIMVADHWLDHQHSGRWTAPLSSRSFPMPKPCWMTFTMQAPALPAAHAATTLALACRRVRGAGAPKTGPGGARREGDGA